MLRQMEMRLSICLAATLCALSSVPAQRPDKLEIAALLSEVKQKSDANWRRVLTEHSNYTYKWRKVWREADKKGKIQQKSEVNELFYPTKCAPKRCRRVEIQLEKDGIPIPPEKIQKRRSEAVERLEKIESHPKAASLSLDPSLALHWMKFGYWVRRPFSSVADLVVSVDGQEILEKCELFERSRELLKGREAIALNFRPRPDAVFSKETSYMPLTEGKIWIDAEDRVLIQLAIWRKGALSASNTSEDLLSRAAAARSMTRTAEGLWFPTSGRVNGLDYPNLFRDMNGDFSIENFDFHYFKTEVNRVDVTTSLERN